MYCHIRKVHDARPLFDRLDELNKELEVMPLSTSSAGTTGYDNGGKDLVIWFRYQ